ncbi:sigma-54-dependent Fis family transcriptional regulator, partial [Candidatus Pacearchaeota archaeon]|nr:sigma-54-dependent Fis family transcriptional regulator [Candidatus Pacearchaeota archaeon]
MNYKILIADDEKHILKSFQERLKEHKNIEPVFASKTKEVIDIVRKSPFEFAVIILDFHFGDEKTNGADVARELYKINPKLLILVFTSDESANTPIECLRAGVNDFINKGESLDEALSKILDYCKKFDETHRIYNPQNEKKEKYLINESLIESIGMVGRSDDLALVAEQIKKISETNSDVTVLIRGESGTGKELIATALHELSDRKDNKMIKINCGAIPANLLESELFGHEKGAFTGADKLKKGRFEI